MGFCLVRDASQKKTRHVRMETMLITPPLVLLYTLASDMAVMAAPKLYALLSV